MARLKFQDLRFSDSKGKIIAEFLGNYEFEIDSESLARIGEFKVEKSSISFPKLSQEDATNAFNAVLDQGLANLTNKTTGKRTLYVHRYSGIPLMGTANFGIIDRNNNMIELRPLTGCNMNCIFCSVDEGITSKKTSEAVVEEAYLVSETKKILDFKGCQCDIIINSQGEPMLYQPLPQLIRDLKATGKVREISVVTNGTLLTETLVDELAKAGLDLLNISINAIDPKTAKAMQGSGTYDAEKVRKMAGYAAKKLQVTLTPVIVRGYNEAEMEKIVQFAMEIGAKAAMQNFLHYRQGRNPRNTEEIAWPDFYKKLEELEKKHGVKLMFSAEDFRIIKTKPLPKPFKKNQVVNGKIVAEGRYPGEFLAAAEGRVITLASGSYTKKPLIGKQLEIKILSDKHNIFFGKALK
jgi:uncharacterized protein